MRRYRRVPWLSGMSAVKKRRSGEVRTVDAAHLCAGRGDGADLFGGELHGLDGILDG